MNTDKALKIDKELFSQIFYYDPTSSTGLRWKVWNRSYSKRREAGDEAGQLYYYNSKTRVSDKHMGRVTYDGKIYPIHRIIWTLKKSEIPDQHIVDHIDGDPFNNHIDNLRCIHSFDNTRNAKKRKDNKTGITGVSIIDNGTGSYYVCAYFYNVSGESVTKQWPLTLYSKEEALILAKQWRDSCIKCLENQGIFYTERHGK